MEKIDDIINILKDAHPQTCAVILALLKPKEAARVLQALPKDKQGEIGYKIVMMEAVNPEQLQKITETIKTAIPDFEYCQPSQDSEGNIDLGGLEYLNGILRKVDRSTEKNVIYYIEDTDPEVAEEVKNRLFLLEDIVQLSDPAIQKVLREIDKKTLAKALLNLNLTARERILKNMSKNAVSMLIEDMKAYREVPPEEIEEARRIIVSVIRHLCDMGEIVIASDDDRVEAIGQDEG